jgi:hypothetical protein
MVKQMSVLPGMTPELFTWKKMKMANEGLSGDGSERGRGRMRVKRRKHTAYVHTTTP